MKTFWYVFDNKIVITAHFSIPDNSPLVYPKYSPRAFHHNQKIITYCMAVTKGRGPGIFPGYYKSEPRLL